MISFLRKFAVVFLILASADWMVQWYDGYLNWRAGYQLRPVYPWSFYSPSGTRIGTKVGYLALESSPFVGYRNQANQKTEYFSVDGRGFRNSLSEAGEGKPRIVLLGGSTAFGTGLQSDESTFGAQLAKRLNAEIINTSVIGYQSGHELITVVENVLDLKPKLVIALDGWNDVSFIPHQGDRSIADHAHVQVDSQLVRYSALTSPYFLVRFGSSILHVLFPAALKYSQMLQPLFGSNYADLDAVTSQYVSNQVKIATLLGTIPAKYLCVIQPDINSMRLEAGYKPRPEEARLAQFAGRYNEFRARVRPILEKNQILVSDLGEEPKLLRDELYMDSIHLNEEGNLVIADILEKKIRALLEESGAARVSS